MKDCFSQTNLIKIRLFNLQFSALKVPEPVDTETAKIDAQEKEAVSEPFPAAGVVPAFCGAGEGTFWMCPAQLCPSHVSLAFLARGSLHREGFGIFWRFHQSPSVTVMDLNAH